ncbi:MAG: hypothetical protein ABSG37_05210 [Candidatus Limnocylindrales bacterium]|jgi:hypothetical protein
MVSHQLLHIPDQVGATWNRAATRRPDRGRRGISLLVHAWASIGDRAGSAGRWMVIEGPFFDRGVDTTAEHRGPQPVNNLGNWI